MKAFVLNYKVCWVEEFAFFNYGSGIKTASKAQWSARMCGGLPRFAGFASDFSN
jgi:hypothetical protein